MAESDNENGSLSSSSSDTGSETSNESEHLGDIINLNDQTDITNANSDEDQDESDLDGSDASELSASDDDNSVTSSTSSANSPTHTAPANTNSAVFKRNKKSNISDPINTEFNNPENINYLEKLNNGMRDNFVISNHPETITHNLHDVKRLSLIKRNSAGVIDDPHHRMIPFITKYEMTRILGVRAQQIDNGAQPTIPVDPELISGYFIAKQEFSQNKLPFIIKRSFPGNGGVEYWNVCDLDVPFYQ